MVTGKLGFLETGNLAGQEVINTGLGCNKFTRVKSLEGRVFVLGRPSACGSRLRLRSRHGKRKNLQKTQVAPRHNQKCGRSSKSMLKVRGMGFEPMQPYGNRFLKTVPVPNKQVFSRQRVPKPVSFGQTRTPPRFEKGYDAESASSFIFV
jgi:hypothetical protein